MSMVKEVALESLDVGIFAPYMSSDQDFSSVRSAISFIKSAIANLNHPDVAKITVRTEPQAARPPTWSPLLPLHVQAAAVSPTNFFRWFLSAVVAPCPDLVTEIIAALNGQIVAEQLSIATFNVWGMPWYLGGKDPHRYSQIGKNFVSLDFDIICLQEMWDQATAAIIAHAGYATVIHTPAIHKIPGGNGLCILSKYPATEWWSLEFATTLGVERAVKKGALYARLEYEPGRCIDVVNLHMLSSSKLLGERRATEARAHQIKELVEWITRRRHRQIPLIVAGDFNIRDTSWLYPQLAALGSDTFALCNRPFNHSDGKERGFTFDPTRNKRIAWGTTPDGVPERLDYILLDTVIDSQLEIRSSLIFDEEEDNGRFLSDHFGVVTTMRRYRD